MENLGVPTDTKSQTYLFIFLACASLLAWFFVTFFKNTIINTGCSEIAGKSSGFIYKERYNYDPYYSFDSIKERCIHETAKKMSSK